MRSGTHKLMPASACVRGKIVSELSATAINGKSAMPTQTFSSFEAYFDANRHSRVRERTNSVRPSPGSREGRVNFPDAYFCALRCTSGHCVDNSETMRSSEESRDYTNNRRVLHPSLTRADIVRDASRVENRRSGFSLPVAIGMLSHGPPQSGLA